MLGEFAAAETHQVRRLEDGGGGDGGSAAGGMSGEEEVAGVYGADSDGNPVGSDSKS